MDFLMPTFLLFPKMVASTLKKMASAPGFIPMKQSISRNGRAIPRMVKVFWRFLMEQDMPACGRTENPMVTAPTFSPMDQSMLVNGRTDYRMDEVIGPFPVGENIPVKSRKVERMAWASTPLPTDQNISGNSSTVNSTARAHWPYSKELRFPKDTIIAGRMAKGRQFLTMNEISLENGRTTDLGK